MELTEEELKVFKHKLLNDYSDEQLDSLNHIGVESIRDCISESENKSMAYADHNPIYYNIFPILDDINNKLEDDFDVCRPCKIKAILKFLFKVKKEKLNG